MEVQFTDGYISLQDAVKYYGYPQVTMLRWIKLGHLRAERRHLIPGFGRYQWTITKEEFGKIPEIAEYMMKRSRGFLQVNLTKREKCYETR